MFKSLFKLCLSVLLLNAQALFAQNFNIELRSKVNIPGQTLANVCGYAANGHEYGLLGASKGLIIMECTNPDQPVNIVQVPGPNNLWKEIKTYSHYAYVTSEGGGGVQIVDLSALPSANVSSKYYTGDGAIQGQLNSIHALHIDTLKGFAYLYGSNLFGGGAVVLNLNDPWNPTYAGKFDQLGYIHDGYAYNDTLYAGHIYSGQLSIVDMSNKANPELLGTVQTPGKFTHNSWLLDDRKHILTTDEATPSFVTSYDISDPTDIRELDRVSTNDGTGSIGHNTHVRNKYAITSWYSDGINIMDASDPSNLVIVGQYDTWTPPVAGDFFVGCWGVYPYLPSGTLIATNIEPGDVFFLTPTYQRAAYLKGQVLNACTGQALIGATIDISGTYPYGDTQTGNDGSFSTGVVEPGVYTVTVSKPGFNPQVLTVNMNVGETANLNVTLDAGITFDINGVVIAEGTSTPLANVPLVIGNTDNSYSTQTNNDGQFNLTCIPAGVYSVTASAWGYRTGTLNVASHGAVVVTLPKGYYDDFALDLGWQTDATASSGNWTLGEPVGTDYQGNQSNPELDSDNDNNDNCYITGNGGGGAGSDDVDNGNVTLTSPAMQLAQNTDAILHFEYWFYNDGGSGSPNDNFEVRAVTATQQAVVFTQNTSDSQWRPSGDIHLKDFITLTDDVRIVFTTGDLQPGHIVEAGVDVFEVLPVGSVGVKGIDENIALSASPNPGHQDFVLTFSGLPSSDARISVRNMLGQLVEEQQVSTPDGQVRLGAAWPTGAYIITLHTDNGQSTPLRWVKQ